jgi:hypothetical protein
MQLFLTAKGKPTETRDLMNDVVLRLYARILGALGSTAAILTKDLRGIPQSIELNGSKFSSVHHDHFVTNVFKFLYWMLFSSSDNILEPCTKAKGYSVKRESIGSKGYSVREGSTRTKDIL